jgi:hypothetical protein
MANAALSPGQRPGTGQPTFVWWIVGGTLLIILVFIWGGWAQWAARRSAASRAGEDGAAKRTLPADKPAQIAPSDGPPDNPPISP